MNLTSALAALAPAFKPTPRFVVVPIVLGNGYARAYNGEIAASVPYDGDHAIVALDSAKLTRVWDGSGGSLKVGDVFVTIKQNRAQFRMLKIDAETIFFPELINTPHSMSHRTRDAILLANKFSSKNAVHAWACGVSIGAGGVVATNNQVLVRVECDVEYSLSLPFWAVDVLRADGEPPWLGFNDNTVAFNYADNSLMLQAQRFAVEMPSNVSALAATLTRATIPAGNANLAVLEALAAIDGRFCTLSGGKLSIDGKDGEQAIADVDVAGDFKMSVETAKLVFAHATHFGFDLAPAKLRFSNEALGLTGFAAGVA